MAEGVLYTDTKEFAEQIKGIAESLKNMAAPAKGFSDALKKTVPVSEQATRAQQSFNAAAGDGSRKLQALASGIGAYFTVQAARGFAASASPNGLQSVDKAFEILSGTIGTILLPGFVVLGGVALVAAESIQKWISEHKTEIIETWVDAITSATAAVKDFTEWLKKPLPEKANVLNPGFRLAEHGLIPDALALMKANEQGKILDDIILRNNIRREVAPRFLANPNPIPIDEQNRRLAGIAGRGEAILPAGAGGVGGGVAGAAGAGNPFFAKLAGAMREIVKDMRATLGTSGITDPVSKWKEVALAVQNSDLEKRKMTMFEKSISLAEMLIGKIDKLAGPGVALAAPGGGR